jgi:hypothetical protein
LTICAIPTAITAAPTAATSTRPNGRAISRVDTVSSASPELPSGPHGHADGQQADPQVDHRPSSRRDPAPGPAVASGLSRPIVASSTCQTTSVNMPITITQSNPTPNGCRASCFRAP